MTNGSSIEASPRSRRGRPPRPSEAFQEMQKTLIRTGVEILSERGYLAAGLDAVLRQAGIPKGSFYGLFPSKEAFGLAVLSAYGSYFDRKLDRHLLAQDCLPLARLSAFIEDAKAGMARHDFRRGCVVGNLGQDIEALPLSFRAALCGVLAGWEDRVAACLHAAQLAGEIPPDADPAELARVFWIGWEGAILRARLERGTAPLDSFAKFFMAAVAAPSTEGRHRHVQGNPDRTGGRPD